MRSGPSFITGPSFGPLFSKLGRGLLSSQRPIDLHARLGGKGDSWYGKMWEHSRGLVEELNLGNVASKGAVGYLSYLREVSESKMTFSPFGYGEVCWRDFEAFALGSLLIKPCMDHIVNTPNLFIPGETYVPLRWDLADFKDTVLRYAKDEPARRRITSNAFEAGCSYLSSKKFLDHVEMLVQDLKLS